MGYGRNPSHGYFQKRWELPLALGSPTATRGQIAVGSRARLVGGGHSVSLQTLAVNGHAALSLQLAKWASPLPCPSSLLTPSHLFSTQRVSFSIQPRAARPQSTAFIFHATPFCKAVCSWLATEFLLVSSERSPHCACSSPLPRAPQVPWRHLDLEHVCAHSPG